MALKTGTFDISSLLKARNQSVAAFGLDTVQQVIEADLEVHNNIMEQNLAEICEITDDRQRISGASSAGEMSKVDEYGRGPTQRPYNNGQVAFPLDKFQYPIGWTREWEQERTPADFAQMTVNAETAHRRRVTRELKRAIFLSANYSFTDYLVDTVPFTIRRLANADGQPIPDGPNGEAFDGTTHNHYLATAALVAANADSLITTVVEHGWGGKVRAYINKAQETTWRAFAGFQAYLDPRITLGTQANQVGAPRLDITRLDNRAIGIYGAAEIWVKPWVPALYAFAFDVDAPAKPVCLRERTAGSWRLRVAAQIAEHPMVAQYMEAKFGFGVWNRTNGAVLYSGGGAYVDPVI